MITGIKINNIRSLDFDDYLHFAPLTILLGKNSSGKSTFLRTFPLIKQTLEIRRSTPLLWYGNFVDFGSFEDTVNKFLSENEKIIKLGFKIKKNFLLEKYLENDEFLKKLLSEKKEVEILTEISIMKKNDIEFINKIEISIEELKFLLLLNEKQELESITLNETKIENLNLKYDLLSRELIPSEFYKKKPSLDDFKFLRIEYIEDKIIKKIIEELNVDKKFEQEIYKKISKNINSFSKNNFDNLYNYFRLKDMLEFFYKNIGFYEDAKFVKIIKKLSPNALNTHQFSKEKIQKLKNLSLMLELPLIFENINSEIFGYFNNISYIAPLRATAQRFYRIQGLDVDSIDSTGSNLPIYLKNLKKEDQIKFSNWIEENFGFKLILIHNMGHVSLAIQKRKKEFNLADNGFGFSQILPILLQIWSKIFNLKGKRVGLNFLRSRDLVFLIEQPELHLHPAMQATLIDLFIKVIKLGKKRKINIKFVLETHSETIVNRVGRHIIEENYNSEDAKIFIFNPSQEKSIKLQETSYDSEGDIYEWPLGFFGAEDILL